MYSVIVEGSTVFTGNLDNAFKVFRNQHAISLQEKMRTMKFGRVNITIKDADGNVMPLCPSKQLHRQYANGRMIRG